MFHRKVYPENTINAKDFIKSSKDKIKNVPHDYCHEDDNGEPTNPDKGRRFHSDTKSTKWSQHCETNWNPLQRRLSCSTSTGNNEHWIKTDAECKYYISLACNSSYTNTSTHINLTKIFHQHHYMYSLCLLSNTYNIEYKLPK